MPGEAPEGRTTLGPWGGPGTQWSYSPESKITQIVIHRNKHYICSIIFKTQNGESSAKFGDEGGEPEKVDLNSSEYITGVCGKYSWNSYVNQDTIRSLCFYTNEKQYGPVGRYEGNRVESFSSRIEGGVVVGFHGCIGGGKQLASIGFYAKPDSFDPPPSFITESGDVGPWGIAGGLSWDDGAFSEVTKVFVNTDQSHNVIHGIKFEYAETNGKRVLSNQHGSSTNSDVVKKIDLSKNGEFIVGIAGLYGPLTGNENLEGITSLWINTNKEKHGPFGNGTRGTHFASNASKGKVVGFHGRSGSYLNAIGLHTEYF